MFSLMRPHSACASACASVERLLPYLSLTWKMLALGGLDLGAQAQVSAPPAREPFLLDRDRVHVVLGGLAGVTDAQARRVHGGPQIRDLPAVLAARRDRRRRWLPGRLPHSARSLLS
jgi:hypothetical protein